MGARVEQAAPQYWTTPLRTSDVGASTIHLPHQQYTGTVSAGSARPVNRSALANPADTFALGLDKGQSGWQEIGGSISGNKGFGDGLWPDPCTGANH